MKLALLKSKQFLWLFVTLDTKRIRNVSIIMTGTSISISISGLDWDALKVENRIWGWPPPASASRCSAGCMKGFDTQAVDLHAPASANRRQSRLERSRKCENVFPSFWVIELLNIFNTFSHSVSSYRVHGITVLHRAVVIIIILFYFFSKVKQYLTEISV